LPRTRKRSQRLSNSEARRRVCVMLPLLLKDVQLAIALEAALESANEALQSLERPDRSFWGSNCYDLITQSLVLELAIVLARLFDVGAKKRHPNTKNIASIPLLQRLLKQRRCQKFFIHRTHAWFPDAPSLGLQYPARCSRAIGDANRIYRQGAKKLETRRALRTLKYFRDKHLAHNVFDAKDDTRPRYDELFALTDLACAFLMPAIYAVEGSQYRFDVIEDRWRSEARRFWRKALARPSVAKPVTSPRSRPLSPPFV
jgi:AbiU2